MAFTDEQRQALRAKLSFRHVKTRASNGATIPYVEGWHVIGEANRIFGYDSWDRTTLSPRCVWTEMQRGQTACFYTAKVRITVRAGGETIVREGIGTGVGRSATAELAHEIALKAAETDATKRALATFGNPFGLALYDKEKLQVTKSRRNQTQPMALEAPNGVEPHTVAHDFVLVRGDGRRQSFETVEAFVGATLTLVPTLPTIQSLYAFWEANSESFAALRAAARSPDTDPVPAIVSSLKARARGPGSLRSANQRCLRSTSGDKAGCSDPEGKAASKQGAPRLRRQSALPHLRSQAGTRPSSSLCPTSGHGDEGLR